MTTPLTAVAVSPDKTHPVHEAVTVVELSVATLFPSRSAIFSTGCVVNAIPIVAPSGTTTFFNCDATPVVIAITCVALVIPGAE